MLTQYASRRATLVFLWSLRVRTRYALHATHAVLGLIRVRHVQKPLTQYASRHATLAFGWQYQARWVTAHNAPHAPKASICHRPVALMQMRFANNVPFANLVHTRPKRVVQRLTRYAKTARP